MQQEQASSQPESVPTVSEVRTRSGRISKPPVRYEPVEQVEDDYDADDYDTDEPDSDDDDDDEESDDEYEDDEDDADEYGNLDGFVVPDKNESSDDDNGRPFPASISVVKKRRT
jgi:ribonuclease E